jgi:hypothetical protein
MNEAKSEFKKNPKWKIPKTWVITSAIAVGVAVLCFAIGIPVKNDEKIDRRDIPSLAMPFNFADDKFAEFKYFVETINQKWRTNPTDLLNFQEYPAPDKYGYSGYGIKDNGLVVEFFYFFNQLYQATINTQDPDEAKRWVKYLDSKFGEKKHDGYFYTWETDELNIVYASESGQNKFHFAHMETFWEKEAYRKKIDSQ